MNNCTIVAAVSSIDRRVTSITGQPYFVSEFGGIWWNAERTGADGTDRSDSWGYGERVRSLDEFIERFEGLTGVLLDDPEMFGYCYTQLTDVFQEQNGLFAFDRSEKVPLERIRAAQIRRAAYEDERGWRPGSQGAGPAGD